MSPAPISQFQRQLNYYYGATQSRVTTTLSSAGVWEYLDLGGIVSTPVDAKGNMTTGSNVFNSISVGWYRCQAIFTFSGSANAVYQIIAELNGNELLYTKTQFSTKGANFWEVQMGFLYHADYNSRSSLQSSKGMLSSISNLKFKVQRPSATGYLSIENATYTIIKID